MNDSAYATSFMTTLVRRAIGMDNTVTDEEEGRLIQPLVQLAQSLGYTTGDIYRPGLNVCGFRRDRGSYALLMPPEANGGPPASRRLRLHIRPPLLWRGHWTVGVTEDALEFTHEQEPVPQASGPVGQELLRGLIISALAPSPAMTPHTRN